MAPSSTQNMNAVGVLDVLTRWFADQGLVQATAPMLQPADAYLDTVGEDLRRRIYLTSDNHGQQLCLRPEFTIPVCFDHISGNLKGGRYCYNGKVFRQREGLSNEFLQAGVELMGEGFGDLDCLKLAVKSLNQCGIGEQRIVLGDKAVFVAFLRLLDMPIAWQKRLVRAFGDIDKLEADLAYITENGMGSVQGDDRLQAMIERGDLAALTDYVENLMTGANLSILGGRTARDIAVRKIEKHKLASAKFSDQQHGALSAFLSLEVPAANASDAMQRLLTEFGLSIDKPLSDCLARLEALSSVSDHVTWKAAFGRRLDYYNGIVFEIFSKNCNLPLCGGGRYDQLLQMLGHSKTEPAVGFSIWVDRICGGDR